MSFSSSRRWPRPYSSFSLTPARADFLATGYERQVEMGFFLCFIWLHIGSQNVNPTQVIWKLMNPNILVVRTCPLSWSGRLSSHRRYRGLLVSKGNGRMSMCIPKAEWWETVVSFIRYRDFTLKLFLQAPALLCSKREWHWWNILWKDRAPFITWLFTQWIMFTLSNWLWNNTAYRN